jgi:dihydroorotate dehydrogenase
MPDWTYQTLFRPLLFRLPAARARALTLGALQRLGANRLGPPLIALLGHTRPAPSLARRHFGLTFPSPMLIGAELAGNERALGALSRFGVGAVEVGPVALAGDPAAAHVERRPQDYMIRVHGNGVTPVAAIEVQLTRARSTPARVAVRLAHCPGTSAAAAAAERVAMIRRLAPLIELFTLEPPPAAWDDEAWAAHLAMVLAAARSCGRPLVVGVAAGSTEAELEQRVAPAVAAGVAGVLVCGRIEAAGEAVLGAPAHAPALTVVRILRARWGATLPVIAGGTGPEPGDALALLDAGADLVQLDAGLVFGGPGLPKRINETLRARNEPPVRAQIPGTLPGWLTTSWLWLLLLGVGMFVGGTLAGLVAATTVVLPYDLAFVGMTREQLAAINPRLLPYMAHNRITLAGTMLAIGVLYIQLAVHAVRFGAHWAHTTIAVSAATGFLSFFLFLGYGYFDPLHAFVSLLLLPLFLLGLRARADAPPAVPVPDLHNDRAWRRAQWGQFGAVALGVGLIGAGATIIGVGLTSVYVPEDLAFLCVSAVALQSASEQLAPLIAHDRAGLGGALVANGLGVLLLGLWGIRRGARWVWWTLLLAGAPGFAAALGVHWVIGYLDLWHLAPGVLGLGLFLATLALLGPYLLCRQRAEQPGS